jgi:hypothetical protein
VGSRPRCAASSPTPEPCSTSAGAFWPAPSRPRSTSSPRRRLWPPSTLSPRARTRSGS